MVPWLLLNAVLILDNFIIDKKKKYTFFLKRMSNTCSDSKLDVVAPLVTSCPTYSYLFANLQTYIGVPFDPTMQFRIVLD